MNHLKSSSRRQPRKTVHSPKPTHSSTDDIVDIVQAASMQLGGVRVQGDSTFYSVSGFGTVIMTIYVLTVVTVIGFILILLPSFSNASSVRQMLISIPIILFWLWMTEYYWFGLTTRTFAKTTPNTLILYGAFGRVRQRFDRRECTFSKAKGRTGFSLRVRQQNRYFSRIIDLTSCANPLALISELTMR